MIVGVDISTMAVHLAWVQDGKPQRWHQDLGGTKVHVIDRIRAIRTQWPSTPSVIETGRNTWQTVPNWMPGEDVTEIAIEFPYSVNRDTNAKLMAVLGTVTRQAPPWARVAWPSSQELRAAIGAQNTKQDAHTKLLALLHSQEGNDWYHHWDEHELDALTACIGWTAILNAQDAA